MLSFVIIYCEKDRHFLPDCVKSIPKWAEVVLVETKPWKHTKWRLSDAKTSPDGRRLLATLSYPEGKFDFGRARNMARRHASREWIFALDSDERLNPFDWQLLATILDEASETTGGFYVTQYSWMPAIADETGSARRLANPSCRIYRNLPPFRFLFPIHEVVDPSIRDSGYTIDDTKIALDHLGYMGGKPEMIEKMKRNIEAIWRHPELRHTKRYMDYIIESAIILKQLQGAK